MEWLGAIAGLAGKGLDYFLGKSQADRNAAMQMQFAKSGIQWRVKDAQKAGIHPLYALGAQTHSFQPQTVGSDFGSMGQDFQRAINATASVSQRAINDKFQTLQIENMGLQNDILKARLASMLSTGASNPSFPLDKPIIPGQGSAVPNAVPVAGGSIPVAPTGEAQTPFSIGKYIVPHPLISDLEQVQKRWGDEGILNAIMQIPVAGFDIGNSIKHHLMGNRGWRSWMRSGSRGARSQWSY